MQTIIDILFWTLALTAVVVFAIAVFTPYDHE